MIEESVLQRTLHRALARRRRLRRGVRRGPAVVERHASTTARSRSCAPAASAAPASGSCAARPPATRTPPTSPRPASREAAEAAAAAASSGGPGANVVPLDPPPRRARRTRCRCCPRAWRRRARSSCSARRRRGPGRGRRDPPGDGQLRRRPPPDPRRQLRRPAHRGRPGAHPVHSCNCVAVGDTGMQTGHGGARASRSASSSSTSTRPRRSPASRRPGRCRSSTARPAPSGKLPVVLKRGAGGVLFHEACGHGLEADLVGKDASVFRGRVGEQVASPLVTLVDDGRLAREWGASAIDDEGAPAQRNVLIEDGVLTDYMWDLVRARKEGRAQQRQRPARDLPAPADGAHDEHVPRSRATRTPTTSSARRRTASTAWRSAAGR